MRRSRNLPLPAGRLDYTIFVSGINSELDNFHSMIMILFFASTVSFIEILASTSFTKRITLCFI